MSTTRTGGGGTRRCRVDPSPPGFRLLSGCRGRRTRIVRREGATAVRRPAQAVSVAAPPPPLLRTNALRAPERRTAADARAHTPTRAVGVDVVGRRACGAGLAAAAEALLLRVAVSILAVRWAVARLCRAPPRSRVGVVRAMRRRPAAERVAASLRSRDVAMARELCVSHAAARRRAGPASSYARIDACADDAASTAAARSSPRPARRMKVPPPGPSERP